MPNIDERVVQMKFDNKQFEAGVSQSLKTLDDLKEALNFDEVEGSLKNIENAFNNLNLSGLADSVDFIASRFEPLGKIADVALGRIADKALDAGKKIADAFIGMSDMSAGQSKYETQTKAVQTITNATGKSVAEVEAVLEKLQKYTDETSYDFAEMVASIGKFTSVGVELERAEAAMEGIASEAAKSGAGKAEANRAMYNFAQALSAGAVKLQDWKSIENANMATKEFKETIIQTAIELGVLQDRGDAIGSIVTTNEEKLKKAEQQLAKAQTATKDRSTKIAAAQEKVAAATKETTVDYKNFNETLSEGWFTSDVLIKTLEKYADTTTDFGLAAYHAAQEALTWTDAIDAVHDAVSSGWMQSFKYMFGDLDEARSLWTDVANALVEYTDIFTSWRNQVLKSWHELGGYNDMIEAASNLWQTFMNIVKGVGEAITNVFPILKAENMTQALVDGTKKLKDWSAGLLEMFGLYQDVEEEEEETAEKAGEIADKTNEITDNTNEAAKAVSGLGEETKKAADNLGAIETGLKRGMRGDNVKKLQKQLMKFGFRLDKYGADGIFGPETQAALKALQREIGVAETGIMDEATKAALQTDEALQKLQEHAKKGISIGARGEDIKKLQKNLNKYLGESDQLIVDGIFGPKTEEAIKKLQKALGVAETGVWDQNTKHALKTKKILLMNVKELSKELKEGMKGADVKKLQQELIKGGYLDKGMADGIYGPKTKEAIKKLQKALGIKQTGEWDKTTQIALHNSQQLTRTADATAKANKKTSETAKKAAKDNKEASKEANKATEHTTVAMMRLQNIVKGWGAALKIAAKFSGAIARIGGNILGMFKPLIDVAYRFGSVFGVMFENLAKDLDENDVYGSFVKKVTNAFGPFGKFIQNVADGLNIFLDSYDAFLEATGKKNTFGSFFGFLKDYIKRIPAIGFIIDVFKTVKSVVGPIISFLIEQLQSLVGWFGSDDFKQGKDSVFNWISEKFTQLRESITKFREDHPELTIENFLNKIKEIGGWVGGKFGEGIDTIKNKFAEFKAVIDQFTQDHPELSISNIFQKIKDTFKGAGDMLSNFFSGGDQSEGGSFFDALKERFKAFEPVLDWMEGIKDRIVKLWQSIFGGGEDVAAESGISKTVKAQITTFDGLQSKMSGIQSVVDWFVNLKDRLINAWNDLTNVGKTGGPDLVKEGGFTSVFDRLGEFSKEIAKIDLGKVISTALKAMAVYSVLNISNGIKNFGKGAKTFGKDIGKMVESLTKPFTAIANKVAQNFDFKGLSKALSERVKYGKQEKESIGTKALKLAGSLLMVVAAIAIVTKVVKDNNQNDMDKALWIIGGILVALGTISILVAAFSKEKATNSKGSMTGILALCGGIYVIVLAIGRVIGIITETNQQVLEKALWIVGGALVILGAISVLIAKFSKGETSGIKGILSLCAGVYVLVLALEKTIKVIKEVPVETLNNALVIVGGMLVLLGIFAVLISATSKGQTSGVKGLLNMCAGIYVLVLALEKTVQLVANTKNKDDLWSAVGIIGGMIVLLGTIAVLMTALSKQPKVKTSIFKSLVGAVAILVGLMAAVVAMITQNNPGVVWQAFAMIAILLGGLGAIAVLMGRKETDKWTNLSSAAVFLSMAFMIEKIVSTIGDVIYKIKDVNPEVLKWFFIGIDAAIGILALLVNSFTKIPLKSILSADVGLLAFIGVLAAGMEMIGSVAADLIDKFSYAIQTLGYCLESFGRSTSKLDFNKLDNVARFVKEVLPSIINTLIELRIDEALGKARSLTRLGSNLQSYAHFISTINNDVVTAATNAITLLEKSKTITEKLKEITFPSIGKEGAMMMFGASMEIYGRELKHTDTGSAENVTKMINESLGAVEAVKNATWLEGATNNITSLGSAIKMYYQSFEGVTTDEAGNAVEPKNLNVEGMAEYIRRLAGSFQDDTTIQQISSFAEGGNNDMYQVSYGITALGTALECYADSIGKLSDKEEEIGLANSVIDKVQEINQSYDKDTLEAFYDSFSGEFYNGTTVVSANIVMLGEALGSYANNISDIKPDKVNAANLVIDKIKEIKQYLGEKDDDQPKHIVEKLANAFIKPKDFAMSEFTEDIKLVGEALGVYGDEISKLKILQIWKANTILESILKLYNNMPLQPGWAAKIMVDVSDLQCFATGIKALGEGLLKYWYFIKDLTFDDAKQESARKILDGIADIAVKLSRGGNWISQARAAVPNIKGLTDGLASVASDLVTFGATVKGLDTSKTDDAVWVLNGLCDAIAKVNWDDLMHATGLFSSPVSKFTMIGKGINDMMNELAGSLDADLKNQDSNAKSKLESVGQTILDTLGHGVTNANISGLQTSIFNAIDTSTFYASLALASVMNTLGTDLLSWIETGLKDETATSQTTGSIESLIGKIKTVFINNWSAFKGMGTFVNLGLATGMKENQSIVTQAAEDVAWAAYLAAKKKLGIKSPSTEYAWLGEMSDEGYANGLTDNAGVITDAAEEVQEQAVKAFNEAQKTNEKKGFWEEFADGAKYTLTAIGDGVSNAANAAGSAIKTGAEGVANFFMDNFRGVFAEKAEELSTDKQLVSGPLGEMIAGSLDASEEAKAKMSEFGTTLVSSIIPGMAAASAEELPKAVANAIENGTPSDTSGMEALGESMVSSAISGMENEKSVATISQAYGVLLGQFQGVLSSKSDEYEGIGQSIDSGIATGMHSNQSLLNQVAEEVAWSAYLAAKKKLGIASPSTEFMWLGEMSDEGYAKGLIDNAGLITNAASGVQAEVTDAFENARSNNENKGFWSEFLDGAKYAVSSIGTGISNAAQSTGQAIGTFVDNAGKFVSDGFETIKATVGATAEAIKDGAFFKTLFGDREALKTAVMRYYGVAESTMKTAADDAAKAGVDSSNGALNAGKKMLLKVAAGLSDQETRNKVVSDMNSVLEFVSNAAQSVKNKELFSSVGKYMDSGIAHGLETNQSFVTTMAEKVAWTAYLAAKKKLGIASPSTEFMWIGEMMDAGLTKGLETYGKTVSNAAGDVADNAVNTAAQGVLALNDVLGFDGDYQPVIRPVLDLSNIQANAGSINDLLTPKSITPVRSAALASNIAASHRSRQANDQNVPASNNGDLSNIVDKFNEKMDAMTEEIKNMKIYMDGTTLVGYVSPRVNRTLGQQATLAGRMN